MRRSTISIAISAVLTLAIPLASHAAGKFSWFDDAPARDALGLPRAPVAFQPDAPIGFGMDAYKSLAIERELSEEADVVRVYGEFQRLPGTWQTPIAALNRDTGAEPLLSERDSRLSGFGVRWQHRVDATNTVALAAGYNEFAWAVEPARSRDMLDTRAALSWTTVGAGELRPGLTSSVFVGDESARDDSTRRFGSRYYGFSVGGKVTVAQDHTPYLSYRLRRSYYNSDDSVYALLPYEDHALVSAGWKWQVQSNWSLQAEASYGLNGQAVDPYAPLDRSRFFFGTRFDFR